jgi:hypothetical protein
MFADLRLDRTRYSVSDRPRVSTEQGDHFVDVQLHHGSFRICTLSRVSSPEGYSSEARIPDREVLWSRVTAEQGVPGIRAAANVIQRQPCNDVVAYHNRHQLVTRFLIALMS